MIQLTCRDGSSRATQPCFAEMRHYRADKLNRSFSVDDYLDPPMRFFNDEDLLYNGWQQECSHPDSPMGGGGPGGFRLPGPLNYSNSLFLQHPHPHSPAGKFITPQDTLKALNNRLRVSATVLRKGQKHRDVRILQQKLQEYGYNVAADGTFGAKTELAVRSFQRKNGLLSDGIAGQKTLQALGIAFSADNNQAAFTPLANKFNTGKNQTNAELTSNPVSKLHISAAGLRFIYHIEAQKGVSNRLHWPGGASGVTLGPGYDMKDRTATSIAADMTAIGVDLPTAQKIAEAAGKQGADAKEFAVGNKDLVNLSAEQETKLLAHIVPHYEKIVKNKISVDLLQHEFDALVSFAYNPGGEFKNVASQINQGHIVKAMDIIKTVVKSKGVVMKGLVNRREKEVALYLHGHQN